MLAPGVMATLGGTASAVVAVSLCIGDSASSTLPAVVWARAGYAAVIDLTGDEGASGVDRLNDEMVRASVSDEDPRVQDIEMVAQNGSCLSPTGAMLATVAFPVASSTFASSSSFAKRSDDYTTEAGALQSTSRDEHVGKKTKN